MNSVNPVLIHVNMETGERGPCDARVRNCPFGSENHFTSDEAAEAHYHASQKAFPKITKPRKTGDPVTYDIAAGRLEQAKNAIDKANRRLERSGVPERFTYESESYFLPLNEGKRAEPRVRLTINTPSVKFDDYTFLAVVEKADKGFVVKSATNVELSGYSPDDMRCEGCGRSIARHKTYLVRDAEGKMLQVGSTCVKGFFGVKPEGLWALTFDPIEKLEEDPEWSQATDPGSMAVPAEETMAYALAISNGGDNFVSGNSAYYSGGNSTADAVKNQLFGVNNDAEAIAIQERMEHYLKNGEAKALIKRLKNLDKSTDYGRNLSVISEGDYVRPEHLNLFVSGVSVLAREKREEAKRKEREELGGDATPGYAGAVGEKLKGRKFKVYSVKRMDGRDYYGNTQERTKVVFRDENNHEVIWWANKSIEANPGDEIEVTSGSIKDHGSYNNVDQTTVTRLRVSGW